MWAIELAKRDRRSTDDETRISHILDNKTHIQQVKS